MLSISSVTKTAEHRQSYNLTNGRVEEFNLLQYRVNSAMLSNVKICSKCNVAVRGDTCPVCGQDIADTHSDVPSWKFMLDKIRTALFIDVVDEGAYAMAA